MNAQLNYTPNFIQENAAGSDSDSNSDDSPEYYQPISSIADDDDEQISDQNSGDEECDESSDFHRLPNGYANCVEIGVSSLDLSDEEEEAEVERIRAASESDTAVRRAFREDESRRNSPLTAENATRVMEAMRRVSFGGVAPDWTSQVPEDQWIEHLQRLRTPPATTSTN